MNSLITVIYRSTTTTSLGIAETKNMIGAAMYRTCNFFTFLKTDVNENTIISINIDVVLNIAIVHITKNTDSKRSKNSPGISTDFASSIVGYIRFDVTEFPNTPTVTTNNNTYTTIGIEVQITAIFGAFFGFLSNAG